MGSHMSIEDLTGFVEFDTSYGIRRWTIWGLFRAAWGSIAASTTEFKDHPA